MSNKGLKKKLDGLWGAFIRARSDNCCEKCGMYGVNAHHIYTRAKECIRWESLNGVALCPWCHTQSSIFSAHLTPDLFMDWLHEDRPKEMNDLKIMKRNNKKLYLDDLKEIEKVLLK